MRLSVELCQPLLTHLHLGKELIHDLQGSKASWVTLHKAGTAVAWTRLQYASCCRLHRCLGQGAQRVLRQKARHPEVQSCAAAVVRPMQ